MPVHVTDEPGLLERSSNDTDGRAVVEEVLVALAMAPLICVPFYWNYVLGLATIMRRTGGTLTDGETWTWRCFDS